MIARQNSIERRVDRGIVLPRSGGGRPFVAAVVEPLQRCQFLSSRFASDFLLEQAGFELSVPLKTPDVIADAGSRPRRLFLVAGNQAEATSGSLETLVVSRGTERSRGHNRRKHIGRNPERDMSNCLLHLSALQPDTQQPPRPRYRACAARGKRRIVTAMIDRRRRRLHSNPWAFLFPRAAAKPRLQPLAYPHFGSKKRFHRSTCQEAEDRHPVINIRRVIGNA